MTITAVEFSFKGAKFKYSNGKVYCLGFGTTYLDHSPHYNWLEIEPKGDLKKYIEEHIEGG